MIIFAKCVDIIVRTEYNKRRITKHYVFLEERRCDGAPSFFSIEIEMSDYLDRAVLEGVVNALIHRNYMEIGSEVHIDMFDDRSEIYFTGGSISRGKDLLKIPSKRRNPILADIFSRLKYMERRGSGFKKILADYEGQVEFDKTKMPVFEADNDDFTLTLYNLNYGSSYI